MCRKRTRNPKLADKIFLHRSTPFKCNCMQCTGSIITRQPQEYLRADGGTAWLLSWDPIASFTYSLPRPTPTDIEIPCSIECLRAGVNPLHVQRHNDALVACVS